MPYINIIYIAFLLAGLIYLLIIYFSRKRKETLVKKEYSELSDWEKNKWERQRQEWNYYDTFYTPELIRWICETNDAELLAATSHLLNSSHWPSWLPSKPKDYDDKGVFSVGYKLSVLVGLLQMLSNKADILCPGLAQIMGVGHIYHRFDNYKEIRANEILEYEFKKAKIEAV